MLNYQSHFMTLKKFSKKRAVWFIPLLIIPALLFLLQSGFLITQDGHFHVYRLAALAKAWTEGVLYPRLFPAFGFDYGHAVLNFYSPLSYWPGAIITFFGFSPATAQKIIIAISLLLAALAMYGFVRYLWGTIAGLIAAMVYTYFPYHLADIYVRGAFPEHFAFIFPPLIFWAYTVAFRRSNYRPPLLWGSLALAGLVFTHNLTTVILVPLLIAYFVLMALVTGNWRRLLAVLGSLLLAMGLSSVYWLPVLLESTSVGIALGPSYGYENHLLTPTTLVSKFFSYHYFDADGFSLVYPLSWFTIFLLITVMLTFLVYWLKGKLLERNTPILAYFILFSWFTVFMITTASLFVWHPLTPIIGHLQYPWRFLALTALGLSVAVGGITKLLPRSMRLYWGGLVFFIYLIVAIPFLPQRTFDFQISDIWSPQRMWDEDAFWGQVGATATGEFLPLTVKEQRWALGRSREGAVDGVAPSSIPDITLTNISYDSLSATIEIAKPMQIRLHQFHLPGWNARIDGKPADTYPTGEMGLVTVDVPAGQHEITFAFGRTRARTTGAILAIGAALIWIFVAWRCSTDDRKLRIAAISLLVLTGLFTSNSLELGKKHHTPMPVQVQLDDVAILLASDAQLARFPDTLKVTLYWFALRDSATDYKAFVHLLDGAGQVIAQHDGDPVGGHTPTTRWRSGEIVRDVHFIPLPQEMNTGTYTIKGGLYELSETPRNLATDPPALDDRVDVGVIVLPQ